MCTGAWFRVKSACAALRGWRHAQAASRVHCSWMHVLCDGRPWGSTALQTLRLNSPCALLRTTPVEPSVFRQLSLE